MVEDMEIAESFQNTEVGMIPNDWSVVTLPTVGESLAGLTYSPSNVNVYGTLVLRSSNVQNGRLSFKDNVFVEMKLPERVIVKENDILICVRNGSKRLIGKCALIDKKTEGSAFGAFMSVLRSEIPQYVFFLFQSNIIQRQINESLGATINQITNKDLSRFQIPLPPSDIEKTKITNALFDTDNLIERIEKLIVKKRDVKQGAIQKLLKPNKDWITEELGEFLLQNPQYGIGASAVNFSTNLPTYLRITDISEDGRLLKSKLTSVDNPLSSNYYLEDGDIVFARTGNSVGKSYLYNPLDGELVFAGFLIKIKVDTKLISPLYLKYYVQTNEYWNWVKVMSMRTGQPGINSQEYKTLPISIPKKRIEQDKITQIFQDIDNEIVHLEAQLSKHKMLKIGMMQDLLTGKKRLV